MKLAEVTHSEECGMVPSTMDPELASNYTILHYNFSYDFLEPTDEEVVAAYLQENGEEAPVAPEAEAKGDESGESDDSDDSDADADDVDTAAA